MAMTGRCYCGALKYEVTADPIFNGQCHCRECQYISGGGPNMFVAMPVTGFKYTASQPKQFTRSDLERAVTREFCAECGTHLVSKLPGLPAVALKVGTFDDPSLFNPKMAIHTLDKQAFHHVPEGMPAFERLPQR